MAAFSLDFCSKKLGALVGVWLEFCAKKVGAMVVLALEFSEKKFGTVAFCAKNEGAAVAFPIEFEISLDDWGVEGNANQSSLKKPPRLSELAADDAGIAVVTAGA